MTLTEAGRAVGWRVGFGVGLGPLLPQDPEAGLPAPMQMPAASTSMREQQPAQSACVLHLGWHSPRGELAGERERSFVHTKLLASRQGGSLLCVTERLADNNSHRSLSSVSAQ